MLVERFPYHFVTAGSRAAFQGTRKIADCTHR